MLPISIWDVWVWLFCWIASAVLAMIMVYWLISVTDLMDSR